MLLYFLPPQFKSKNKYLNASWKRDQISFDTSFLKLSLDSAFPLLFNRRRRRFPDLRLPWCEQSSKIISTRTCFGKATLNKKKQLLQNLRRERHRHRQQLAFAISLIRCCCLRYRKHKNRGIQVDATNHSEASNEDKVRVFINRFSTKMVDSFRWVDEMGLNVRERNAVTAILVKSITSNSTNWLETSQPPFLLLKN